MPSAFEEYTTRLDGRRTALSRLDAADRRLAYARLAVFATGILLAWLAFSARAVHTGAVVVPVIAFFTLVRRHAAVITAKENALRAIVFYERGLARLEDRWQGGGESGDRFRNPDHPYAEDLDLFGTGSLFELLSVARTRAGEETLAAWLLAPASPAEIAARQDAVRELAPRLDFREALALAGTDVRATVMTEALTAWATAPPRFTHALWQPAAAVITATSVGTAALWLAGGPGWPIGVAVLLVAVFSAMTGKDATTVLHGSGQPVRDLHVLAHALAHIEATTFQAPWLVQCTAPVTTGGGAARAIRHLQRLSDRHDWQHNAIFAFVAAFLLWGPHLAFAVERWRAKYGQRVVAWLRAVGEVEALASLAARAWERPEDAFPAIVDGPPRFDAGGLGHPLLPAAQMVRNDVRVGHDNQAGHAVSLLIVSGSNMSGKSTLLRAVGINAVLAYAGAPVRATSLELTPLAVGATLRVQDSLQDGRSRFFAEISRLRELADLAAGQPPLLFLLDELLHGTNSHDRLVGGTGVLRALLDRGAIGLVTTHDLALTAIATEIGGRAANVHFEDTFDGDRIRFDYRMRTGPVTRSNALALMRAVGLDVPNA
ncbi:MAG: DNA mismatch repair protein MutS [Vicinamibacterales bacterium]